MLDNNNSSGCSCVNTLFICGINWNRGGKDLRKKTKRKQRYDGKHEGSKVQKMKEQYRPRQVNRAPALYNAGCVQLHNKVSLKEERKKSHGELNRIIRCISRVSRSSIRCLKRNSPDAIYYTGESENKLRESWRERHLMEASDYNCWKKNSNNYTPCYCKTCTSRARIDLWRTGFELKINTSSQCHIFQLLSEIFKCFPGWLMKRWIIVVARNIANYSTFISTCNSAVNVLHDFWSHLHRRHHATRRNKRPYEFIAWNVPSRKLSTYFQIASITRLAKYN